MFAKPFKQYFKDKEYNFIVKISNPSWIKSADVDINKIKDGLAKYKVLEFGSLTESPFQEHPLDFPQLKNVVVFSNTVKLGYPITDGVLKSMLCQILNVPDQCIVVYNENDPRIQNTKDYNRLMSGTTGESFLSKDINVGLYTKDDVKSDNNKVELPIKSVNGDQLPSDKLEKLPDSATSMSPLSAALRKHS